MKEEKFKLNSFIGGWYIDPKVCDDLIFYFEKNKHRQRSGVLGNNVVDEERKKSIEINLNPNDTLLDNYNNQLQKCLLNYVKKYPELNTNLQRFNSYVEGYNIQKYLPKGGFYKTHCERESSNTRCLVFMTYLNTVKNGGTIFKYQNITTQAKKGLTLIWPTDFTHMHKGQICDETKYIITGWYNFL